MTIPETLSAIDIDRIIEMAWEDRTSFEAIEMQFGFQQQDVIKLMRKQMKASSFKLWRQRTKGKTTKHEALRSDKIERFKCSRQKTISHNKISKR
ncbi:MAG: TIGR03643 family protein [Bacteroidota bacterium]|nr:TIGR03643 family protein [Bacteroidota bacterium]